MAGNQYKFSIEARPLKAIYNKYGDSDMNSSIQAVRPLGCIRKDKRSSAEKRLLAKIRDQTVPARNGAESCMVSNQDGLNKEFTRACELSMYKNSDLERNKRKYENKGTHLENKDTNNNTVEENDINSLPCLNRSKSQLFEHRFKIASSRRNGQESPSPILNRSKARDKKKRVIQLPLFRVDLKTYSNESEVTRTVARTRESLRQLMEIHRSKMKTPNMVAANIKHYEFVNPSSPRDNFYKGDSCQSVMAMSQPFPAKPAIKPLKSRDQRDINRIKQIRNELNVGAEVKQVDKLDYITLSFNQTETTKMSSPQKFQSPHECIPDEDSEESFLTNAIRPETALTLASTMSQMDRVLKSPGSDELREISEVFMNTDQPCWPSFNDYQRLKAQSHISKNRTLKSISRPNTVINYQKDSLPHAPITPHSRLTEYNFTEDKESGLHSNNHANVHKPILRYTSKQSTFKLDPIVVPSHTCTECPMCNIYQRDFETPCPPNSPMSSQFHLNPEVNGPDKISENRSFRTGRQDLLHVTRINMNGTPTDDVNVMNTMKAS